LTAGGRRGRVCRSAKKRRAGSAIHAPGSAVNKGVSQLGPSFLCVAPCCSAVPPRGPGEEPIWVRPEGLHRRSDDFPSGSRQWPGIHGPSGRSRVLRVHPERSLACPANLVSGLGGCPGRFRDSGARRKVSRGSDRWGSLAWVRYNVSPRSGMLPAERRAVMPRGQRVRYYFFFFLATFFLAFFAAFFFAFFFAIIHPPESCRVTLLPRAGPSCPVDISQVFRPGRPRTTRAFPGVAAARVASSGAPARSGRAGGPQDPAAADATGWSACGATGSTARW